jgi:hypothetical protein
MGCIAILGYTLYAVKNDQEPSFFGIDLGAWFQDLIGHGNSDDDGKTGGISPASAPSNAATDADPELFAMVRDTLVAMATVGQAVPEMLSITEAAGDPSTLQYSVLTWLANDPSILEYSGPKMLQRYVLGCFYWSLQDVNTDKHVLDTWMTYEDECEFWKTTTTGGQEEGTALCDESSGEIVSLHLENVGLMGTLAPELALLSNSLGTC